MKSTVDPAQRLVSLDALRGFDMFWILGMEELAAELGKVNDSRWARFITCQLDHAAWQGFHFLDLIFPLFVFMAGASMIFSLGKSLAERGPAATVKKIVVRSLILYVLGLICYGGIAKGVEHIRWLGVLQRIALCYLFTGLAFVHFGRRGRLGLCVGLLIVYWAIMTFVPVPGGAAPDFAEGPTHNIANWLDFHYLPGHRWDKTHDPEGYLSTLPAIATCLLGLFAGEFLRQSSRTPARKAAVLLAVGAGLAALGWLWGLQFPVIKKLWTSSYVLVAGGYSCALLGAFYYLIDVRGWKAWATPFVWIGMNAIALYLSHELLDYESLTDRLFGGPVAGWFGDYAKVWMAAVEVGLGVLLAWILYRARIFIRV